VADYFDAVDLEDGTRGAEACVGGVEGCHADLLGEEAGAVREGVGFSG
jgi:hypothetical protein